MIDAEFIECLRDWGARYDIVWESGLSAAELHAAEARWGFRFPPDLRELHAKICTTSPKFIHWARTPEEVIAERLDWPRHGFRFDIEHDDLWLDDWGGRPASLEARFARFDEVFQTVPRLIPIFGHRYIPAEPHEVGNPVFSVYQSDIIYYGVNLRNYFKCEFLGRDIPNDATIKQIPFWSDWADGRYDKVGRQS